MNSLDVVVVKGLLMKTANVIIIRTILLMVSVDNVIQKLNVMALISFNARITIYYLKMESLA